MYVCTYIYSVVYSNGWVWVWESTGKTMVKGRNRVDKPGQVASEECSLSEKKNPGHRSGKRRLI